MSNSVSQVKKISRKRHILSETTPFVISEAYRTARTNLMFSLATSENKIVAVTSCSPGEGKSTSCANLAIAFAETEAKVLVIDADMRKPTIHSIFGINNKFGLSSILGGFCKVGEAVNEDVRPNLDVIIAGPIPPNQSELLSSSNMSTLLEAFALNYDYIFIDTPPANVVSDSQLMNNTIAGLVFVVKEESTTHPSIKEAMRSVKLTNGKILGFLKVGCNSKGTKNYKNYKYDYAYEYKHKT